MRKLVRLDIPERVAMMLSGHKTRSVFERYNIVSPGDLLEAARTLDTAHGHNSGHNAQKHASGLTGNPSQVIEGIGAGDGDRTRDIKLGKLAFYR